MFTPKCVLQITGTEITNQRLKPVIISSWIERCFRPSQYLYKFIAFDHCNIFLRAKKLETILKMYFFRIPLMLQLWIMYGSVIPCFYSRAHWYIEATASVQTTATKLSRYIYFTTICFWRAIECLSVSSISPRVDLLIFSLYSRRLSHDNIKNVRINDWFYFQSCQCTLSGSSLITNYNIYFGP